MEHFLDRTKSVKQQKNRVMKKFLFALLISALCSSATTAWSLNQTNTESLPKPSKEFLHKYFSNLTVSKIEECKECNKSILNVTFTDGSTMLFDSRSGDCYAIMLKSDSIPNALLTKRVADYIGKNYASCKVTSLRRTKSGNCIGLSNGTELYFDREGKIQDKPADGCKDCKQQGCKK